MMLLPNVCLTFDIWGPVQNFICVSAVVLGTMMNICNVIKGISPNEAVTVDDWNKLLPFLAVMLLTYYTINFFCRFCIPRRYFLSLLHNRFMRPPLLELLPTLGLICLAFSPKLNQSLSAKEPARQLHCGQAVGRLLPTSFLRNSSLQVSLFRETKW